MYLAGNQLTGCVPRGVGGNPAKRLARGRACRSVKSKRWMTWRTPRNRRARPRFRPAVATRLGAGFKPAPAAPSSFRRKPESSPVESRGALARWPMLRARWPMLRARWPMLCAAWDRSHEPPRSAPWRPSWDRPKTSLFGFSGRSKQRVRQSRPRVPTQPDHCALERTVEATCGLLSTR